MRKTKSGLFLTFLIVLVAGCTPTTPRIALQEDCVEIAHSLASPPVGIVVLQDEITRSLALLDLKTGQKIPISLSGAMFIMAISPDNKRLAHSDEETGQLIITSSSGERISAVPVPEDWIGVVQWMASDTLLMERFIYAPYYGPASTIVYDIVSGEKQEFPSDYPGIVSVPLQWGNHTYTRTVYDPSFSRVAYLAGDKQEGQLLLILRSLDADREIVKFYQDPDEHSGGAPQWMRNGTSFVVGIYPQSTSTKGTVHKNTSDGLPYVGGFDLFQVSRDGKIQRLTYLTTEYQAGEEGFSLSPDEKHVAFWLNRNYKAGDLDANRQLAILNISTGEITNLCLPGGTVPVSPIWSPDGKYLVVSRYYGTGELHSDVILVDLEQRNGMNIAENAIGKGWLVK